MDRNSARSLSSASLFSSGASVVLLLLIQNSRSNCFCRQMVFVVVVLVSMKTHATTKKTSRSSARNDRSCRRNSARAVHVFVGFCRVLLSKRRILIFSIAPIVSAHLSIQKRVSKPNATMNKIKTFRASRKKRKKMLAHLSQRVHATSPLPKNNGSEKTANETGRALSSTARRNGLDGTENMVDLLTEYALTLQEQAEQFKEEEEKTEMWWKG